MLYIGLIGSRRRNEMADFNLVSKWFSDFFIKNPTITPDLVCLVSGGCPKGADSFVHDITSIYKLKTPWIYLPDWAKYGKQAGFQRNTYIAQQSDMLVAVVASDRTGGTEDTIRKFKKFYPERQVFLL